MATAHHPSAHERPSWQNSSGVFARRAPSARRYTWTKVADTPSDLFGVTLPPEISHLALISDRSGDASLLSYSVSRLGEEQCAGPHPRDGTLADLACDILRRCLGLPTAAGAGPPSLWTLRAWLELLLESAADPDESTPDWRAASRLHPAGCAHDITPHELALAAVAVDETLPWRQLHAGAASGHLVVPGLSAAEAAWMDHPFFARWLLAGHRDVEELLHDLHLFLPPEVASAVELTASMIGRLGFERHESGVP